MNEFIFLTSGPIDYSFKKKSLYDSIVATSLGVRYPRLKRGAEDEVRRKIRELNIDKRGLKVVCASSSQTRETAKVFSNILGVDCAVDERLNAILFDFEKLMDREEFEVVGKKAFDIARPRFLKAFFENKLLESKLAVKKRIDLFIKDNSGRKKVLAISHSFLMMIFRAYFLVGETVFSDYHILNKQCQPEKRMFGFLTGFLVKFTKNQKVNLVSMLE